MGQEHGGRHVWASGPKRAWREHRLLAKSEVWGSGAGREGCKSEVWGSGAGREGCTGRCDEDGGCDVDG